jgi:hypothetical protein
MPQRDQIVHRTLREAEIVGTKSRRLMPTHGRCTSVELRPRRLRLVLRRAAVCADYRPNVPRFSQPRALLALDLTLDFDAKSIAAVAELEVTRVDGAATELSLDAVGFVIDHVAVAALPEGRRAAKAPTFRKTDFVYDGETLLVAIAEGSAASVRVTYRATPRRGLYFLAPDEHVKTRPRQVWTQCQDEDARHVFPCHDKPHVKQTTEARVTAPAGLVRALERRARGPAHKRPKSRLPLEDERAAPELPGHDRRGRASRCSRTRWTACRSRTSCRRGARRTASARSRARPT